MRALAVSLVLLAMVALALVVNPPARVCWPSAVGVECLERGR